MECQIFLPMSFIHLEFIFVYDKSWYSSFMFLHVAVQISPHHLLKRLFLLHFMLLTPLSNTNSPKRLEFISGLSVLFCWSMCLFFMPLPGCFDYSGLVIQFDIRYCKSSCFVLLSQICCNTLGSFMVPYKFLKCLFYI